MMERPELDRRLSGETFRSFYYLKAELVDFCRENGLPTSGGKIELTDRIACFLDTGRIMPAANKNKPGARARLKIHSDNLHDPLAESNFQTRSSVGEITEKTQIEPNFICSEKHRAFFKEKIGKSFSFNVGFQKWLKSHTGNTYGEAIEAYHQILEEKKKVKTTIDKQFEYNTYIRDFYADNTGRPLEQAIKCWKYKKSLPGHNRYEKTDLAALEELH